MKEKHGYFLEDLSLGMTAVFAKTVGEADITMFAGISGDTNPVHLDQSFAEQTMFAGRIAHGMLSASFISTVFGTRLPGPGCIYLRQELRFKAPVKAGDTVEARVTVKEIQQEKKRVVFDTVCSVGDKVVLEGEAMLMVHRREDILGKPETEGGEVSAAVQAAE
jgi:3-hydroxybutyryl-CoA dehydratase